MGEIKNILQRTKLRNIVSYIMNDTMIICEDDQIEEQCENLEQELKTSYETLYSELEKLYPGINRDDDKLFDAVVEFAHCHDTIYFTIGMIIGRNMYKEMEEISK